jgi:predicted nucleic acid-binding protein
MTFADIPAGATVFLDANTFVYYFVPHPVFGPACSDLLERIEQGKVQGITSAQVLSDVAHRLRIFEAAAQQGWP